MGKKILVCDDQEIVREIVGSFLTRKGYEVVLAQNGEECLDLIKKAHFDSIFLDIKMPGRDGISVMKELDRLGIRIQIILMSGADLSTFDVNKEKKGLRFLAKPFALDAVIQVLSMKEKNTVNRILVVDDQDMLREMLKEFFSGKGYEIVEARNGKECIEFVKENKFDAIFMDVRMPEMDGLAALDMLRESGVQTPVFIMSGYGEVTCVEDAVKRGAQNFLAKPFKLENALAMLSSNKAD